VLTKVGSDDRTGGSNDYWQDLMGCAGGDEMAHRSPADVMG
jgi:hypothetical protein